MRVVIDHCMKPQIRDPSPESFTHWAEGMARLAGETGALVKVSAQVTEAGPGWTVADLKPDVDHVIAVFGPERMMWGSDWPVCRLAASYEAWRAAAEELVAHLPAPAQARIFGGTAAEFHGV